MKKTDFEETISYNFITRYLHDNKHKLFFQNMDNLFKKRIFLSDKKINILDLGCGPAYIFSEISKKINNFNYIGIEPREDFYNEANKRYSKDKRFKIYKEYCENYLTKVSKVDIILSFDCFEHIPLEKRQIAINIISKIKFEYMFVNVPNEIGPAIFLKNFGSYLMGYMRHKEYSFLETFYASIYKLDKIKPHTIYHKGFDWRTLYYDLRYYFDAKIKTSPFNFVPILFSPSIFIICKKK